MGFKWLDQNSIQNLKETLLELFDNIQYGQDYSKSCVLEVDLYYDASIHDNHQQFPFCAEHSANDNCIDKKLLTTLHSKENYIIYFDNLVQCMQHGLKLKEIHKVIEFEHKEWMKEYIDLNTHLRAQAKSKFEQDVFKLFNNSIYGKTLERVDNYKDIRLCTSWKRASKYISKNNYLDYRIFKNNLVAIEMKRTEICYDKPIYVGQVVLEISKLLMYDFHYNFIQKEISKDFTSQLCYVDTDSFIYFFVNKENSPNDDLYAS